MQIRRSMSDPLSPRRSPTNSANTAMFRSNNSAIRLDSTLSGTFTATTDGGTSADNATAPMSGGLPQSPTPQSAEMDALLKEKSSLDQHDLEANPTGKPEAEGPAGGDVKVRRTYYRAHIYICTIEWFWFTLRCLFCLHLTNCHLCSNG